MRALIDGCARHPVVPNLLMLLLLGLGAWGFLSLRIEVNPEVAKDEIEIVVPYPGAPPGEVEEAIVVKIEQALRGTAGVRRINATAREGMARVVAELDGSIDDRRAVLDDVRTRVGLITTFPEEALDPIINDVVFASMAFQLVLYGDAPERTLREVALDLRDELGRRGVSTVRLTGIRDYEIAIEVSRRDLEAYGLDLGDVTAVVRRGSINLPGGSVRTADEEYKIEVRGRRYTGQEYADLVLLARGDGTIVRLGDVARIVDGFEDTEQIGRYQGQRAVVLNLMRVGDEDTIEIAGTARALIGDAGALLPEGLRLAVLADFSTDLEDRIDMLVTDAWQGLVLVFLALWAFLELRLATWVALGIPTAIAFSGIVLAVFDQSLNMINLFGLILVLGSVVDDGIVIGENAYTHARRGGDPVTAAVEGAYEIAWPTIAAAATTIIAFMPLFFVAGVMGKFIAVLPLVVIAVLVGSTIEGFCILPGHLAHRPARPGPLARLGAPIRRGIDAAVGFVTWRLYAPLYRLSLRARYATLALSVASLFVAAGLVAGGMVPFVLFPASDTVFLRAEVSFPEGTSLGVTRQAVDRLEQAARRVNERHGGAGRDGDLIAGIYSEAGGEGASNKGLVYLTLVPSEERTLKSYEIINFWREETGPIPNTQRLLYTGVGGAGLPTKDIEVFLSGGGIGALREAAAAVQAALATYDGVFDIESDLYPGKRELQIALTPAGRTLGLTMQDVAQQLRSGFFGDEALKVQRGRDEVIVRVRLPPEERSNLENFFNLRIRTPAGQEVPLAEVAEVELARGVAEIRRRDGRRQAGVFASVDKTLTTPGEILADFRATKEPEIRAAFPAVEIAYEGSNRETAESIGSLSVGFAIAMFGLYAVLALVFRSYLQPILIMLTIPLGMVGAIVGHYLLGYQLTMLSLFGIVALAGVVVKSAILLIETINGAHRAGATVQEAVEQTGPQRLRPIFLTTATTVIGLLPLLAERSFQAQFLKPMALSLAAGLIFATLLTLFVVPCLYLVLNDVQRLVRWLFTGAWPTREAAAGAAVSGHDD